MTSRTIRAALAGAALALGVVVLVGVGLLFSGSYNVAATTDHSDAMRWFLETGQRRSVATRATSVPQPPTLDAEALEHGFIHFDAMCVQCHGAPGVERGEVGLGINPRPPGLSDSGEEWSARELFWITKHGIKLAGMPAFGPTHSDDELWAIVEFVRSLPAIDSAGYQARVAELRQPMESVEAGETGAQAPAEHSHAPGTPAHTH